MGYSHPMISTRSRSILSAAPRPAPRRAEAALLHTCQAGAVLRTVLLVEGSVAVAALFAVQTGAEWVALAATATVGALPGALLWLVAACALRRPLAAWPPRRQCLAGLVLGALSALYGCALLRLTGLLEATPWLAGALAGALFAALVMADLALRARAQAPAALAARLQELQARIRPHFLFNTLNSAIALVREEPARAETLLEDLSELFRCALADAGTSVTLADEIALAERYLAIEQVRFGERLRIEWAIDPAAGDARLPPLLLQPLVENAVRHGVEPSPEGASLRIRTERRGDAVVIEVVNSLPPLRRAEAPLAPGHGIALANVRDRLRLLHDIEGQFRAGIADGRYRVRIDIPAGQDRG